MKHRYDFGLIGNCAYLALIGKDTNVSWLCWPRFDSSFLFGSLLDSEEGGEFSIKPATEGYTSKQYYLDNTAILVTEFTCVDGIYKVVDFAPRFYLYERYYKPLMFARRIIPVAGTPRVKVVCRPKGSYGQTTPDVLFGSNHLEYQGLERNVRLTSNIALSYVESEKAFVLNENKYLALTWGIPLEAELETTVDTFYHKTKAYWGRWVKRTSIGRFHQESVIRSALTLKLHQFQDTGAIIAATTTSLPESPGSTRNWDYRYCWIRDSHYTLKALTNLGHFTELEEYAHYIENIALTLEESGRFQPLYSITGESKLIEKILPLKGYLDSNEPVRIGNQAYEHIQNDVYGQVLVSLLPLFVDQRLVTEDKKNLLPLVTRILRMIEATMHEPDAGLWEFRNKSQLHAYTFLFHWAGAKAAIKIGDYFKDYEMMSLAERLAKEAERQIEACYDEERGVYTQAVGTKNLDASLLQLITMGYLDPNSEKARRHVVELEKELRTKEGLFFRYRHADDFGEPETTFLICAFWYVEALAMVGRLEEAIEIFEQLSGYGNELGLLSEDVDAKNGSQWGNFPQAYSHVGQVNAAFAISKKLDMPDFLS
ncbi:glycoside hydrolase family 15 protein [Pontibacter sp. G13]|uniref:glycoside hydrolase family 15 protein n=1 Tax=Pontibacter sp. G13 TaxID=3074898 RepID=UPI0028891009|nr:glycoside hydrolase family 15 protein [Pontibacter sp. G13]WNJ19886.1 glycoside hydrolase family 15 protein [Pontibacter sp. G13]